MRKKVDLLSPYMVSILAFIEDKLKAGLKPSKKDSSQCYLQFCLQLGISRFPTILK